MQSSTSSLTEKQRHTSLSETKTCLHCGKEISQQAVICPNCRNEVVEEDKVRNIILNKRRWEFVSDYFLPSLILLFLISALFVEFDLIVFVFIIIGIVGMTNDWEERKNKTMLGDISAIMFDFLALRKAKKRKKIRTYIIAGLALFLLLIMVITTPSSADFAYYLKAHELIQNDKEINYYNFGIISSASTENGDPEYDGETGHLGILNNIIPIGNRIDTLKHNIDLLMLEIESTSNDSASFRTDSCTVNIK